MPVNNTSAEVYAITKLQNSAKRLILMLFNREKREIYL